MTRSTPTPYTLDEDGVNCGEPYASSFYKLYQALLDSETDLGTIIPRQSMFAYDTGEMSSTKSTRRQVLDMACASHCKGLRPLFEAPNE